SKFLGSPLVKVVQVKQQRLSKTHGKVYAIATVEDDLKGYTLPSWAEFEIGQSTVYWSTEDGMPPTSGEKLAIYYNPVSSKLAPNPEYGIAFNGGFNQPIMCGGEPRAMSRRDRGKMSDPFYVIKILVPQHALTLVFSFTDGTNWDGPYKLQFEVPAKWRNKPISFFNEGLTAELSQDGACERAIYAEANFVVERCAFPANLVVEGGDRCKLDFVTGCTDPASQYFNPLAN
ncbi:hypothetical protein KI387_000169, partial [Taxus chinensis]